jgi:undecaprenyl pyrophosphate synthase
MILSICVSTEALWPDFTIEHLKEIITYAKPEERLFGGQRTL